MGTQLRNQNGEGLLVYVRNGIAAHQLTSYLFPDGIECLSLEVILNKKKWVLFSIYRPSTRSQDLLFDVLGKALDHYSEFYENFMFLGDFNAVVTDEQIKKFLDIYSLKNIVRANMF